MTLKTKMSLLVFLTTISIVSVGFSSWSITAEAQAEIQGNIEVDNVIVDSKGLQANNLKIFEFYETGFISYDQLNKPYITTEGHISATLTIDINECKSLFTSSSLLFTAKLSYSQKNSTNVRFIFNYLNSVTIDSVTPTINLNGDSHTLSYLFNDILDNETNYTFTLDYKFLVSSSEVFYKNVYNKIYDNIDFLLEFQLQEG